MARATGFEPATSGVTGRCSDRLSYAPALCLSYVWEGRAPGGSARVLSFCRDRNGHPVPLFLPIGSHRRCLPAILGYVALRGAPASILLGVDPGSGSPLAS